MTRINAAMERIDAARAQLEAKGSNEDPSSSSESGGSQRVMALVNAHEKLRDEVSDTIGELDALIEELEG